MAGLIPPATLEQIRAASDIVEVIGSYVPLKHAGANFVALCPFHREKSPSFNVSPHRQIFHCFGCHKGGDVFTFVREYENLSFLEAVRRLAERARIPLEVEDSPGGRQTRHLKETLLQLHEQITQRWQSALSNDAGGQIARDYLAKRQMPAEAVNLFRLGYAPDAWDDTVNWSKGKGYDLAIVEQAGLIIRREGEARYYDRFRGRLMFPICDEQGRVIAFSGRVLAGDEKTAKYVNSPETPLFTKGKVIYGLDKSRRALLDAGFAVICEGQIDLISCFRAGVQNVVAPQGTALTGDHVRILKRYVDEVVLCFDSDTAGQNAALRSLDDLIASGLAIRVATVPPPHDPDSFIKAQGPAAFRELIQRAPGFFDYLLGRLCAANDLASDRGRSAVVRGMGEAVRKTGNAVLADTFAQKTAQRLAVSVDAVRTEFRKLEGAWSPDGPGTEPVSAAPAEEIPPPPPKELWLLKLLLMDETLMDWTAAHLNIEWLQHPLVRRVVEHRLKAHAEGTWQSVAAMLGELTDPATQRLVTAAVSERRQILNASEKLVGVVNMLRKPSVDRPLTPLARKLDDPALSAADRLKIQEQLQALERLKRER